MFIKCLFIIFDVTLQVGAFKQGKSFVLNNVKITVKCC